MQAGGRSRRQRQAPSVAAVDRAGRPVSPALIWMDRRSEPQCERWLHAPLATPNRPHQRRAHQPYYLAPKLALVPENEPEAYAATHRFLLTNGYIACEALRRIYAWTTPHGRSRCYTTVTSASSHPSC